MRIEAVYDHGRVKLPDHIQLRHQCLRVVVIVPGDEVVLLDPQDFSSFPADLVERAKAALARMAAIKNAPLPTADELPELTEKQLNRIEAAALRDEIKGLRQQWIY